MLSLPEFFLPVAIVITPDVLVTNPITKLSLTSHVKLRLHGGFGTRTFPTSQKCMTSTKHNSSISTEKKLWTSKPRAPKLQQVGTIHSFSSFTLYCVFFFKKRVLVTI